MSDSKKLPQVFKFVNKDANSGSLSNNRNANDGGLEVNRHVQRVRQLRKDARLIQETDSTKRLIGWHKAAPTAYRGTKQCPRCRLKHEGQGCPPKSIDPPIGSPADPFESLVLPIDTKIHRILQYYVSLRQPRGSTADSNIAGFTLLDKHDEQLSLKIVKTSLSSPTDLQIIALLAGVACRMKFFNGVSLAPRDYPENYTVKAIQTFRKYIDAGQPITDQVVLAMHNLSMAEYSCKNFAGAKLYWKMTREMVILLGGFAKFEPYVAWLCLSADYMIAASTFTLPELDFIRSPKLSGLDVSRPISVDGSADSLMRLQILVRDSISLTQVIGYIHDLPPPASTGVKGLIMANRTLAYRLITMPLQHQPFTAASSKNAPTSAEEFNAMVLGDAMIARARRLALVVWLWHTSLGFLTYPADHGQDVSSLMAQHVVEISDRLQLAEKKLAGSGWSIREDLVLWLCLLGCIVSISNGTNFMTLRLGEAADRINIQSEKELEGSLRGYLSLHKIPGFSMRNSLLLIDSSRTKLQHGSLTVQEPPK